MQGTLKSQSNHGNKIKIGEFTLPNFKIYSNQDTIVQWHKDRYIEQLTKIKSVEIYPYIYGQLTITQREC